jgi:GntR family transcriptional regulator
MGLSPPMNTADLAAASRAAGERAAPPLPPQRRRRADRAREIADVLRQQILYGGRREQALPDENALIREFGTTRNTVREALGLLRDEGLVERVPGIGTFVVCEKYPHGLNTLLPAVARRLGLAKPTEVVYLERLRSLNGLVLSLDLTYLHPDVGGAVLAEDLVANDVFVLIERLCGQRLGTAEISVEAVNADPHSAALLQVPEGSALLMVERLAHLEDGRPVDLEYIRFRGDRVRMNGLLSRPNLTSPGEEPCR